MRKILHIIRKEFIQIRRDRAMRGLIFVVPILQLLVLGYVISSEVKHVEHGDLRSGSDRLPAGNWSIASRHTVYFDVRYFENRETICTNISIAARPSWRWCCPEPGKKLAYAATQRHPDARRRSGCQHRHIALGYVAGILENFMTERLSLMAGQGSQQTSLHLPDTLRAGLVQSQFAAPAIS